jgi:hypothetical protein
MHPVMTRVPLRASRHVTGLWAIYRKCPRAHPSQGSVIKNTLLPLWVRLRPADVAKETPPGLALERAVHDVQTDVTKRGMREGPGNGSDHGKAMPLV